MRTVSLRTGVVGALIGAATLVPAAIGQTFPANYTATSLATGVSAPTCMALAPDGSVYICQQGGTLRRWTSAGGLTSVATFTVDSAGERGLIGVALDPNFATNRFAYVHYTSPTPAAHNTVNRITLNAAGTAMVAGSEVTLLAIDDLSSATNHNGGAAHFGPDGRLYVSVGDNANGANSQSITSLKGKILRLNPDPASPIPTDNPTSITGITGTPAGNDRAIWAAGLRNPFTFAFHPVTGRMFINDVGENTWEEINDGLAGHNYGWSVTEGSFTQASFPNFTEPLVWYQHSDGTNNGPGGPTGIGSFTGDAIVGGVFYSPFATANANFPISYSNVYFFGDEVAGFIRTFDPAQNNGGGFATGVGGVVDLKIAPDNTMLVLRGAGGGSGILTRVTYTAANGACCTSAGACTLANGLNCAGGSTFIWGTASCSPNPCSQATGACCAGSGCSVTTAAACAAAGTHFSGASTTCNAAGNNTTPCCKADFDQNGTIALADIFSFLTAWFVSDPRADFNGDGGTTINDIFDFLAAWFVGC